MDAQNRQRQLLTDLAVGLRTSHGCSEESAAAIAEKMLQMVLRDAKCRAPASMCRTCGSFDPEYVAVRDH